MNKKEETIQHVNPEPSESTFFVYKFRSIRIKI